MAQQVIVMSKKEAAKLEVMSLIKEGKLSQVEAGERLRISVRQIGRLYKRYKVSGATGLVSKKRGQPSNNRLPEEIKRLTLEQIRNKFIDFGPTLALEKLSEIQDENPSRETLRKWMIADGLWEGKKRKMLKVHQMRERRSRLGELVQIDGSPHDWFEGRGEECCLLVFIDDATSKILQLHFVPVEATFGYFEATRKYIERCGVPVAFYSDKHSIFRINTPENKNGGETQFQRAVRELGIELICANSPQAKGRVERANGILQDRLVKELRLRGISDIETANAYLPEFMQKYNEKFAKEPKSNVDMHRRLEKSTAELDLIFSEKHERMVSKNLEFSHNNVIYQLQVDGHGYALKGAKIEVYTSAEGVVRLVCLGKERAYKCYEKSKRATPIVEAKEINRKVDSFVNWKPAPEHPWRKFKISRRAYVCEVSNVAK